MGHCARLLATAVCADEYLALQIKSFVAGLDQLDSEFTTALVAMRRGRRLDEGAHGISFRTTYFGARERGAQKGPSRKVGLRARTPCVDVSITT